MNYEGEYLENPKRQNILRMLLHGADTAAVLVLQKWFLWCTSATALPWVFSGWMSEISKSTGAFENLDFLYIPTALQQMCRLPFT